MEKIAMKCTREDYESIKQYIGDLRHISPEDFIKFTYLCSFGYNDCLMSNDLSGYVNTKYYETFDKAIFLKACGIKIKKDKRKKMFKKTIKLIKALDNEHCNITYIGTDSGYALNAQGDKELDGSFTITITGNKTK